MSSLHFSICLLKIGLSLGTIQTPFRIKSCGWLSDVAVEHWAGAGQVTLGGCSPAYTLSSTKIRKDHNQLMLLLEGSTDNSTSAASLGHPRWGAGEMAQWWLGAVQRTQVLFPGLMLGDSKPPVTLTPGDPMPRSDVCLPAFIRPTPPPTHIKVKINLKQYLLWWECMHGEF